MSEWIEYTGSDEQIEEIQKSEHGWMTEDFIVIDGSAPLRDLLCIGDKYLICDPHPYANEIKIWADTGCPVYWRSKHGGAAGACHENFPPFAHPNEFEYLLTPFED